MSQINGFTGCCAVDEIADIVYDKGPEDAIRAVLENCSDIDYDDDDFWTNRKSKRFVDWDNINAFYVFTGVERLILGKDGKRQSGDGEVKTGYASKLAEFIKENKLGTVQASLAKPNRANHPSHVVRIYIWTPSITGLRAYARKIQFEG